MKIRIGLWCMALAAQTNGELPAFDVASLKVSPEPGPGQQLRVMLGRTTQGEVLTLNTNLSDLILLPWLTDLASDEQIRGPDWIRSYQYRYNVDAKSASATPTATLLLMTQRLLNERFHLAMHHEPKVIPHLELTVAKTGAKLKESKSGLPSGHVDYGPGRLYYNNIAVKTLAILLSRQLNEPVLDLTGIEGFYDVRLDWMPEEMGAAPHSAAGAEGKREEDMSLWRDLFAAVQADLGLQLERKKTPMDVLVIDRADQVPVGN